MSFALSEQKYEHVLKYGFPYQSVVPCCAYTDQPSHKNHMYDTDDTYSVFFVDGSCQLTPRVPSRIWCCSKIINVIHSNCQWGFNTVADACAFLSSKT